MQVQKDTSIESTIEIGKSMRRDMTAPQDGKGNIPNWIRSTSIWKFLSNLKLTLKRISRIALYRGRSGYLKTFLYFMAVEYPRLGWKRSITFLFKGIEFNIRPMEWHLMDAILLKDEYGLVTKVFREQTPDVIIDAGANVGMFSVYALTNWPSAKLFAIEPSPDTFRILEGNQKKNPGLIWRVFPYAFWKYDGSVYLENTGLSMAAHVSNDPQGVEVSAVQLDHFIDRFLPQGERVSILKMDIEGAEEAVLTVAQRVLNRVDAVVIEIHPAMCNDQLVRGILRKEYEYIYELSAPSTKYPVILACRVALENSQD